jgi:class 3 adenylate cyclase/esterase/lipase
MNKLPTTQYAKSGDLRIAYQVMGEGSFDIIYVPGWISHLELNWEMPAYTEFMQKLSSFCRVIMFDKRGTGMSDRNVSTSTLEERMEDLRAVLDSVGSEQCWVLGYSEGGALAMMFSASYPERVKGLLLFGTMPCGHATQDIPEGDLLSQFIQDMKSYTREGWGQGYTLNFFSPSLKDNELAVQATARMERFALSPSSAMDLLTWIGEIDARPIAKSLHVPTLVMHRKNDRMINVAMGRWLGSHIPNALYVEMSGDDHLFWGGNSTQVLNEIKSFMTGTRHDDIVEDRVLATVLFTDIVASTERAVDLGDRAWRNLLEDHNAAVRRELTRHQGREVDTAGDGFFAAFDGPAKAIRCATAIRDAVQPLGIEIRAGVHTGECERIGDKLAGVAVHTGARVQACAGRNEVWVSGTVRDLVAGSGLVFDDRGTQVLKGIPGECRLFEVT